MLLERIRAIVREVGRAVRPPVLVHQQRVSDATLILIQRELEELRRLEHLARRGHRRSR
jgi:hypothetical protein